ncbi:signal peptidase I [Bacillus sp. FJAT-27225]|uniref:signal peptidase I n=1 Tax=Bacillus sp. FJAT-27225 TaxID=1743144 RepID=UPI00080C2920|nr:signal peptidase I [Bacillus sp. FJAT-27225]OCA87928.1 signal peptidase I [Bacillus sp. FJAT-27225]
MANRKEVWEWMKSIGVALAIVVVVRAFLFTPVVVEGASMMPTLHNNERMMVNKIGDLERFDIVVFHANEEENYIKRIIGLPGDKVEYKNDKLYVNGKDYEEEYLDEYKKELRASGDNGPLTSDFTFTVPKNNIFVMGDNRRKSMDSRHIGPVSMDKVIGKTNIVFWPIQDVKILDK